MPAGDLVPFIVTTPTGVCVAPHSTAIQPAAHAPEAQSSPLVAPPPYLCYDEEKCSLEPRVRACYLDLALQL